MKEVQESNTKDRGKEHTHSDVSEINSNTRTSSYIRNISTSQLENWIDQSIKMTREKKRDREAFKAYMEELRMEEKRREREADKMESYADAYIAELERRRIEEELNIGYQDSNDEEA